jgi:hypothetical protein
LFENGGTVKMTGGTISANWVPTGCYGGGVYVNAGSLTLVGVNITKNGVPPNKGHASSGGGIYINAGIVSMSGGWVQRNYATFGGGIYNYAGNLTLKNEVTDSFNGSLYQGGGMYLGSASTTTFGAYPGCMVSGNSAIKGAGVYEQNDPTVNNPGGLADADDPNGKPIPGP